MVMFRLEASAEKVSASWERMIFNRLNGSSQQCPLALLPAHREWTVQLIPCIALAPTRAVLAL